ncbi:MAG: gliding motility-associated C-terminal domain-containing protein [Saprospiraceae bacterium]|nr:gliding motility-associated C-terminal domain-containing protein [Saprospiraceae bacterium]
MTDVCSDTLYITYQYLLISGSDTLATGSGNAFTGPYPVIPDSICQWSVKPIFITMDECGNINSTLFGITFTVKDSMPPVFLNLPPDITVQCDDRLAIPPVSAIDYCDRSVTVQFSSTSTQSSNISSCAHTNYSIERSWTATDACGNTARHRQKITVKDTLPPVFTGLEDVTVSCPVFNQNPDSLFVKPTDICSIIASLTQIDTTLSNGCTSIIQRSYTAADVCGNSASFVQKIFIAQDASPTIEKSASDEQYSCSEIQNLDALLAIWVNNRAGASGKSVCSPLSSFAAIKGSYKLDDKTTWPGTLPVSLPKAACPSPLKGYLRSLEVDFVFFDSCGNAAVTSGVFGVADTIAPVVSDCPENIQLVTLQESCEAQFQFQIPEASDNCSEPSSLIRRTTVVKITSPQPAGFKTVVDTAFVRIGPINPNTVEALTDGSLSITLRNVDIDGSREYFTIYTENGWPVANTPTGAGECETITFALPLQKDSIQRWIADGYIDLTFAPHTENLDSIFFINNICGNSQIETTLTFESAFQNSLRKDILLNGKLVVADADTGLVNLTFGKGENLLQTRYIDCARNVSVCEVTVIVEDKTAPVIQCPPALTVTLPSGVCQDTLHLNTQWLLQENCDGMRKYSGLAPSNVDASKIGFVFKESNGWYEALSSQMVFRQVFPVRYIQSDILLEVEFFGDNGGPEKSFELIGPGGFRIGKTATRTGGGCGLSKTTFSIPVTEFNQWVKNGEVTIIAIPDIGRNGVRPCGDLASGSNLDNISYIQATMRYSDARFDVSSAGATVIQALPVRLDSDTTPLLLKGGTNVLTLSTSDGSGNQANCKFEVTLKDEEKPQAKCKKTVVQLDPSGTMPATVTPQMVDDKSSDNCGVQSMMTEPSTFDCSLAGTDVAVTLFVFDKAGNKDSCTTTVLVKPFEVKPTYTSGLCANDTLKLFSNLPTSAIPGTYSYFWDGPGTLDFFTENVFIPNVNESYNGVYMLTVKGFNDCVSTGSVLVNIKPLINPKITASDTEICENGELILTCTQYSGEIEYQWYQGIFPTGVLLKKSPNPELMLNPSVLGANFFYVIAQGPQCSSNPSVLTRVNVLKIPVAAVNDLFLAPCEGDDLKLGSPVNNPNFTYHWSGPAGYDKSGKDPEIIQDVTAANGGNYYLVIKNKKCVSDTAVTRVVISERPPQPTIVSADIFCEGATFSLVAAASPNAEIYEWRKNNQVFTVTQDNSLIIPNAQSVLQGTWEVVAIKGNCRSAASAAKFIAIDNSLEVGAINSGPICAGDSVRLQATFVPNATYQWQGPAGIIPSVYNPVIAGVAGDYSVTITTPTGCQNKAATMVSVISVPEITALSNDARPCMKPEETVRFFPSVFPQSPDYNFVWKGPNQFASTNANPVLSPLTAKDTGVYTLIVYNKGCPSKPLQTRVSFTLKPSIPVITPPSFFCTGDTIRLNINSLYESYIWQTPIGQIITTAPVLEIAPAGFVHGGNYSVVTTRGQCASEPSATVSVSVRQTPAVPLISSNSPVCFGDTLLVKVSQPAPQVTYRWDGPVQISSRAAQVIVATAGKSEGGIWTVVAEKDGCSSEVSLPLSVTIKDEIAVPAFTEELIAICQNRNNGAEICLKPGTLAPGALYTLINKSAGDTLAMGNSNCYLVTNTQKLKAGANFIIATAQFDGCMSAVSTPLVLNLSTPPNVRAEAITNQVVSCPGESVQLISKDGPPLVQLQWTSPDPNVRSSNPVGIAPIFTGFKPGLNEVFLSYSIQGCPDFSMDTIFVYVEFNPNAFDDVYSISTDKPAICPVTLNDSIPAGATIEIIRRPEHGLLVLSGNAITYTPDPRYLEDQTFVYKVCADFCDMLCDEATVRIELNEEIACKAPNIFTPNGDGINDALVIPCLSTGLFPNNRLLVFNEWGMEVYSAQSYNNDWEGNFAGQPLPVGTYYFILELGDGSAPVTSFLVLQR